MPMDYEPIVSVADANDEVWFDIVNRTITPQNEASIVDVLVQKDKNSRNLGFHIQRYFEDEDLSTKKIRIHYVNSVGQRDIASAHSIEVIGDQEDVVSFKWLISDKVCWENGNVQFAIEFYNNNETYKLFTKPTTIGVEQGVDESGEFLEPQSDWFTEYSARMTALETNMENFNSAVDNGEFDGAYAINTFANALKNSVYDEIVNAKDVAPIKHNVNVKLYSKNLFNNQDDYSGTAYTYDNGVLMVDTQYVMKFIKLQAGNTYTFSCVSTRTGNEGGGIQIRAYKEDKNGYAVIFSTWSALSQTVTFTLPNDYPYVRLAFYGRGGDETTGSATYTNIMLEEDSTASAYVPWVDVSNVKVYKSGKNLIPYPYSNTTGIVNGITYIDNGDGGITISGTATEPSYFGLMRNVNLGDMPINAIHLDNATNGVYAVNKRLYYDSTNHTLSIFIAKDATVNETVYPQLELGTVATAYEPYAGAVYTSDISGIVSGVVSMSPTMVMRTNIDNVMIDCEYIRDTNIVFDEMEKRISNIESVMNNLNLTNESQTTE